MPDAITPGPNKVAIKCEAAIAKLEAKRAIASRSERKAVNQRLRLLRDMLAWCKTRAGYIPE